jgi:ATP-dependent Lhr-like helicase
MAKSRPTNVGNDFFQPPAPFGQWFDARGWRLRPHQAELLRTAGSNRDALLIAPTGSGKTLAGFLPSLIDLTGGSWEKGAGLHTLYISPLKALASDVARNLLDPVSEMRLPVSIDVRTGDTPPARRARQRARPPDILLTTPEQLALFLASAHAGAFFATLRAIIIDEAHALAATKRGDLLSLGLSSLRTFAPHARRIGLSATVGDPAALAAWIGERTDVIRAAGGAEPRIEVLDAHGRTPWAGHSGRHAVRDVYERLRACRSALVFVNTRAQAELIFQELWAINDDDLPIALHHGSLDPEHRRRVEQKLSEGGLRAVVCTSTLDLGLDWGAVDLVIQIGAPKGCSRLVQRIGRSNHRLEEASAALLVPSNLFESLECRAAVGAIGAGEIEPAPERSGAIDMLAQHICGKACGDGFDADALYAETIRAAPYAGLTRERFERTVDLVATGGYALRTYDRFRRIVRSPHDGRWRARTPDVARRHRENIGAVIEEPMLSVHLEGAGARAGRRLGAMESYFFETLSARDAFLFAGERLRLVELRGDQAIVRPAQSSNPLVPSYNGGQFPMNTHLAARVRALASSSALWRDLPDQTRQWLDAQAERSILPAADQLLVETFARAGRHYLCAYPFEGRLAHQTLGMLLTRRLERSGHRPLGFVASDYALAIWMGQSVSDVPFDELFSEDMLGDDLDAWLQESAMMKRAFRNAAILSGLIDKPGASGARRSGALMSTDLIYDVLRSHEPGHLLLEAARADASEGLLDIRRLGEALARFRGRIVHAPLKRISPFAAPLMLEVGREPIGFGAGADDILREAEEALVAEAMRPAS